MKTFLLWIVCIASMVIGQIAVADELVLESSEIENLGIELASPIAMERIAVAEARARVVMPPKGERVLTAFQPGVISVLHVAVGDAVHKGQILAEVQSPGFLTMQREYLNAFNEGSLAQLQVDRDRQLFAEGIISQSRLEETETRAMFASARLNEQKQLLVLGGFTDKQILTLAKQQAFHERLVVRAPIDGIVLDLMGVAGEQVDTMDPMYRLGDLSRLLLEIEVPQELSGTVALGMKVAVADCIVELPAVVESIGHTVNPVTQTVTVRAKLTHPDHALKLGQFVSVQIVTDNVADANDAVWAISSSAVVRSDGRCYVFTRTESGFAVREVNIVGATDDQTYLNQGVSGESLIAVAGTSALKAMWLDQKGAGS